MKNDNILVSVVCDVYNHEPYLRQCFDGFVMQKTNFKFEVLVHDDASTDKSAEIIIEYTNKYPDIFKPIIQKENQYSKGVGIWKTYQFPRVKGKYVALCEGDDYWTDPLKLQSQVEYMETHPGYTMCFHNAAILNETDVPQFPISPIVEGDFNKNQIFEKWIIPTASVIFKYDIIQEVTKEQQVFSGDINLFLTCASHGKIHGFYKRMSVYRIQNNGLTLGRLNISKNNVYKKELEQCYFLFKKFELDRKIFLKKYAEWEFKLFGVTYEISFLLKALKANASYTILLLFKRIVNTLIVYRK